MSEEVVLEIDVKKLRDGTCRIIEGAGRKKYAICREGDKIKIYPVVSEEE